MGFGGIGIWQLLIILLIVIVLFGTKKLKTIGTDLGGAVKGFKKAIDTEENDNTSKPVKPLESDSVSVSKDKSQL